MNNFFKVVLFVVKVFVLGFLFAVAIGYTISTSDYLAQLVGSFLLYFLAICTLFAFFLKKPVFARFPEFLIVWKVVRVLYMIVIIFFLAFGIWAIGYSRHKADTQAAVDFINSKKIVLLDVFGNNLPPKPDQNLNDSTIAGIDANNNFIRDDVELAIFEKYPDSAKIRAAELQYAQALQLELTQVFDSGTLVATLKKASYATVCIGKTGPEVNLSDSREKILANSAIVNDRIKEIDDLVLNIAVRREKRSELLEKYMTTYSSPAGQYCDINLSSLPN